MSTVKLSCWVYSVLWQLMRLMFLGGTSKTHALWQQVSTGCLRRRQQYVKDKQDLEDRVAAQKAAKKEHSDT